MKDITINNFENENKTIAVGDKADNMVRRDAAWWKAYNEERSN